jgi:small subunit ribosomal protein S21
VSVEWLKSGFKRESLWKMPFVVSKRKVQTEDIIKEVKKHSFYLKPGEKKRVKQALARKRNRKKIRRDYD